jgi:gliding motility-associated-like protein
MLYRWDPPFYLDCEDCETPLAQPEETTTYVLTYSDVNGCFVSDTSITITVLDEVAIHFPNAFTPNVDQLNDEYMPKVFGISEVVSFSIFDRWGKKVFETNELDKGWDGRVNGQIAAHNAMFSYRYIAKRHTGEKLDETGVFILISK